MQRVVGSTYMRRDLNFVSPPEAQTQLNRPEQAAFHPRTSIASRVPSPSETQEMAGQSSGSRRKPGR